MNYSSFLGIFKNPATWFGLALLLAVCFGYILCQGSQPQPTSVDNEDRCNLIRCNLDKPKNCLNSEKVELVECCVKYGKPYGYTVCVEVSPDCYFVTGICLYDYTNPEDSECLKNQGWLKCIDEPPQTQQDFEEVSVPKDCKVDGFHCYNFGGKLGCDYNCLFEEGDITWGCPLVPCEANEDCLFKTEGCNEISDEDACKLLCADTDENFAYKDWTDGWNSRSIFCRCEGFREEPQQFEDDLFIVDDINFADYEPPCPDLNIIILRYNNEGEIIGYDINAVAQQECLKRRLCKEEPTCLEWENPNSFCARWFEAEDDWERYFIQEGCKLVGSPYSNEYYCYIDYFCENIQEEMIRDGWDINDPTPPIERDCLCWSNQECAEEYE